MGALEPILVIVSGLAGAFFVAEAIRNLRRRRPGSPSGGVPTVIGSSLRTPRLEELRDAMIRTARQTGIDAGSIFPPRPVCPPPPREPVPKASPREEVRWPVRKPAPLANVRPPRPRGNCSYCGRLRWLDDECPGCGAPEEK